MRGKISRALLTIGCILLLCACLVACDSKKKTYEEASELYNSGSFSEAQGLFESLGEYEDSQDRAIECRYEIAVGLFENEQYDEAHAIFSELGDYKDSAETANACSYAIAENLFEDGQYEDACSIYQELENYADSADKAELCSREIGMSSNADYDFLAKLETSVLDRLDGSKANKDQSSLVNTELAYLDRFKTETFYDMNLKALADQYIDGLYNQRDALSAEYECDYQVIWQKGLVERYGALNSLYEQYGFMADNKDFVASYVMEYDYHKALLNAYEAIEADLTVQFNDEAFYDGVDFDGYDFSFTVKNNTEYTYSTVFDFSFKDDNDTIFYSNSAVIENVHPGESYIVSVYLDISKLTTESFNYMWSNYYTDVVIN